MAGALVGADPRGLRSRCSTRGSRSCGRSRSRRSTRASSRTSSAGRCTGSNAPRPRPWSAARSRTCPASRSGSRSWRASCSATRARGARWGASTSRASTPTSWWSRAPASPNWRRVPASIRKRASPGIPGTTAIAGHRTTWLAPFRHIDALRRGDRIVLDMPYAHFTYTVSGQRIVAAHRRRRRGRPSGLQPPRALRVHSAVQRRKAHPGVCAPHRHGARGRRARRAHQRCSNPSSGRARPSSSSTAPGASALVGAQHASDPRDADAARLRERPLGALAVARRRRTRTARSLRPPPRRAATRALPARPRPRRPPRRAAARRGRSPGARRSRARRGRRRWRARRRGRSSRAPPPAPSARPSARRGWGWSTRSIAACAPVPPRARPSSTASPAPAPPRRPVTPIRSPARAPSRPTSSSLGVGPADHGDRDRQRGRATTSPPSDARCPVCARPPARRAPAPAPVPR